MALIDEIREQPSVAERQLAELPHRVRPLAAAVRRATIDYVLIAARGTSDHAATYAQYAIGSIARLPVALAAPSLFTQYRTPLRIRHALVIGISQSGQSPDVVSVVEEARRQGAVTAAITNDPASPLAGGADHLLPINAGIEASVAATKTYIGEMVAVAVLAATLGDPPVAEWRALRRVPDAILAALSLEGRAAELAAQRAGLEECVILGRGYNLSTALEWALKLRELAYVRAHGYSTADFQHGPVASLPPGGDLLAVSAAGPMASDLAGLLVRLRRERRARPLCIAEVPIRGIETLAYGDALPEWLSPIAAIVPAQLFTVALTAAKGLDAARPRGLKKVTLTR
jgi:glucosamine--fructose-6-phosphate aminotransferase (isomerizing)